MDDFTIDVPATLGLRALFVDVAESREPVVRLEVLLVVLPLLLWLWLLYRMLLLLPPLLGRMMFTAFGWLVSFDIEGGFVYNQKEEERKSKSEKYKNSTQNK